MKRRKLTKWYPSYTPPERQGVYELRWYQAGRHFAHYRPGFGWGRVYGSDMRPVEEAIQYAYDRRWERSGSAHLYPWRGLDAPP